LYGFLASSSSRRTAFRSAKSFHVVIVVPSLFRNSQLNPAKSIICRITAAFFCSETGGLETTKGSTAALCSVRTS
jgi:hypothetical protein